MNSRSSIIPLPGQGWVSDFNPALVERMVEARFTLVPVPVDRTSNQMSATELGLCVSSELSPSLDDAERLFKDLRLWLSPPYHLTLVVVGPSDLPLAFPFDDPAASGGLVGDKLSECFPSEHIGSDYLGVAWTIGTTRRDSFRLQRCVRASSEPLLSVTPTHKPPTSDLSLDQLLSIRLGGKFSKHASSSAIAVSSSKINGVEYIRWRNATVTIVNGRVAMKELILHQTRASVCGYRGIVR
jgi:hypothetical protein